MKRPISLSARIKGAIYGSAIGDGYGLPTEFKRFDEIHDLWPPNGPNEPMGTPILVTDDTQMALAVGDALMDCYAKKWTPDEIATAFVKHFITWLDDPKNNRAPGMTCLTSCEGLAAGKHWTVASARNAKGCGANMRVLPVGLLAAKGLSKTEIGALAQLQSAITHSHPTALAASDITAICIAEILDGTAPKELLPALEAYATAQQGVYHAAYLQDIWGRAREIFGS